MSKRAAVNGFKPAGQPGPVSRVGETLYAALSSSKMDQFSMSTRPASIFMPTRCCPDTIFWGSSGADALTDATSNDFFGAVCCADAVAIPNVRTTSQLAVLRIANLQTTDVPTIVPGRGKPEGLHYARTTVCRDRRSAGLQ